MFDEPGQSTERCASQFVKMSRSLMVKNTMLVDPEQDGLIYRDQVTHVTHVCSVKDILAVHFLARGACET
jgi:hypothetical protein